MKWILCVVALPLWSAPTLVGSAKYSGAASGGSLDTATIVYTPVAGNALIATCHAQNLSSAITEISVRDDNGTFTRYLGGTHTSTTGEVVWVWYSLNVAAGAHTITCNAGGPGGGAASVSRGYLMTVLEYSGFGTSIIGDGSNPIMGIGTGTTASIGLLQAANVNVLLLGAFTSTSTSAICITAPGSGWTIVQSNSDASTYQCGGVMSKLVSAGTYTADATIASANWVIAMVPFVASAPAFPASSTGSVLVTSNGGYWQSGLNVSNGGGSAMDTFNGNSYLCYAATDLSMKIAKITSAGSVTAHSPTGVADWANNDEHNMCSLQVDTTGIIHLTYDMHTSALKYCRSDAAEDPSAFTCGLSMLGGTPETNMSFANLFKNPSTGALYFTYHFGPFGGGGQYFYGPYNTSTHAWVVAAGTGTAGLLTGYTSKNPFVNGIPQWKSDGTLWFGWQLNIGSDDCGAPCSQYLLGWNGSTFIKFGGAAATVPVTEANLAAVLQISAGALGATEFTVLNSFSIDSAGTFFLPWFRKDTGGIWQGYVAESSTGSFVAHTLTNHAVVFNPPNPVLWVGQVQSPTAVSIGACTYFMYPDVFRQRSGEMVIGSCDNFSTTRSFLLTTNFNPNWMLFPNPARYANGTISFTFINANDAQFRFTYLNNFSSQLGRLSVLTWNPGGSGASGKFQISGNATIQ